MLTECRLAVNINADHDVQTTQHCTASFNCGCAAFTTAAAQLRLLTTAIHYNLILNNGTIIQSR